MIGGGFTSIIRDAAKVMDPSLRIGFLEGIGLSQMPKAAVHQGCLGLNGGYKLRHCRCPIIGSMPTYTSPIAT